MSFKRSSQPHLNGGLSNGNMSAFWDTFLDSSTKTISESSAASYKLVCCLNLLKIAAYLVVFAIIFVSSMTSVISYVMMTMHLRQKRLMYSCNKNGDGYSELDWPVEETCSWTWTLVLAFSAPNFLVFLRSLRFCVFKNIKFPTYKEFFMIAFPEILYTTGLAQLTFMVLPYLNISEGVAVCNCTSFVPAFLIFSSVLAKKRNSPIVSIKNGLNFISLLIQSTVLLVWIFVSSSTMLQASGISLLFISTRWWENFAPGSILDVNSNRRLISKQKYKIYVFLAPLKIIIFALIGFSFTGDTVWNSTKMFLEIFKPHYAKPSKELLGLENKSSASSELIVSHPNAKIYLLMCQVMSSYFCYIFAKFACKIHIQNFSMVLPISMTGPVAVIVALAMKKLTWFHELDVRSTSTIFFEMNYGSSCTYLSDELIWLWLFCWLAQLWTQRATWQIKCPENAETEEIFICPYYCGFLVGQCIIMNARSCNGIKNKENEKRSNNHLKKERVPQLFVCATMWHENQEEMVTFLKSIIRLDEDQCARRMIKAYVNNGKPDNEYYKLEANIFFDDAFDLDRSTNSSNPPLNQYVRCLIMSIEKAAREEYGQDILIRPPTKFETPYGGRLVWCLPGRSKLIAHLKNKDLVRHKKRWSQVMYMYYILGYRLMELENISARDRVALAESTYILALDGDIDFQPQAVQRLVNRMKVVEELGAACGRIHPVGRGLMVWYQIFEYAIGHWLQKSTEHIIGCVLCSPGCFSLFRGSALMRNGVMKKYTSLSEKPAHHIQYDQGEDRWLCTLLLKQGLRVEYAAASDAFTHSPETFNEFYNQRRRWIPSTIANIFDLLSDADVVVKTNSFISTPYIAYQVMLMVGTVLGPGTIFLMMVGAFVTVFSINIWTAFLWNFFPLLTFIAFCVYFKQKYQLILAFAISTLYCLVMMAVLIGIIIQIIDDGPLAPASVFFLIVFCQIVIAGLVHPQEARALLCGVIYYVTIPSMYMLLLIYSVFNMDDISWGTREVVKPKTEVDEKDTTSNEQKTSDGTSESCWVNDSLLIDSPLGEISMREKQFWKGLIKKYLKPIYQTKEAKQEAALQLKELRNTYAFAFLIINSIFVLIVFLLQLHKDHLHLDWPVDVSDEVTYDDANSQIYIYRRYKELDPIGLCFVLFFGLILIIQFFAMFLHRFSTLSQMLATTTLNLRDVFGSHNQTRSQQGNFTEIALYLQQPQRPNLFDQAATPNKENNNNVNYSRGNYTDLQRNFEQRFFIADQAFKKLSSKKDSVGVQNLTHLNVRHRLTAHSD